VGFRGSLRFYLRQSGCNQVEFVLCDEEAITMLAKMRIVLLFVLTVSLSNLLYAQGGANGTILGTVTDTAGAVVANARINVTNVATNVTNQTQTTSSGDFAVPFLPPGTYRVIVESSGFQKAITDSVTLLVGQQARVNVALKPGQVSETVEVQANSVSLDTDTAAVTQIVTPTQIEQLPVENRNFVSLLFLGAGAVQTNGEQGQMRQGEGNAISINGGRPTSNNYTLDGLINTDTALNTPAVILSQDAIQEFKIQSETYSAEYGFSANQVNLVSKSGSNQLHGTAFEFLRNDAFDAKAPFQQELPELRQNQFGFVLGGPIYIPKVYDGRNKTFFMVNYEGWRIRNGFDQSNFTVPDPAQLNGDFSNSGLALPVQAGGTCNPSVTPPTPCMPIDPLTGAPFPGNTIPSIRFSTLASQALNPLNQGVIPAPNCVGCGGAGFNYRLAVTLPQGTDQQTYRLDQELGKFGKVFFRFTTASYDNTNINGSVSLPDGIGVFHEKSESWMISHTKGIGSRIINNFRFGRLEPISIQGGTAIDSSQVSALGIGGVYSNLPAYARLFPTITLQAPYANFGSQVNDVTTSDIPTWQFSDTISIIKGRHTISTGFDYRRWLQRRNLSADFLGDITYANDTIANNGSVNNGANGAKGCTTQFCGTGNAIADFLLGYYSGATTFQPTTSSPVPSPPNVAGNLNQYQFRYFAPFLQDDWKATSRLTLNLGLRWDYRSVPTEKDNKMFWLDRSNPLGGLCYANKALGTQTFSNLGGPIAPQGNGFYSYCGRSNPAAGSKKPFAPRVGFAYRLGDKTVLRGGYGIFFDSFETREIDDSGDIYPFVVRANDTPSADAANCGTPGQPACLPKVTDGLFPAVPPHQVSPAQDGGQFFAVIISERPHNPYVQQWSLSLQRELARNTTFEANYVGNKGTHLLNRVNIGAEPAPPNPAACDSLSGLPGAGPTNTSANCLFSQRRPYQNFTSILGFLDSQFNGYSSYNAGNLKIERRSSSMALLAAYTWSKSLDDKSAAAGVGSNGGGFSGHMSDLNPSLDYGRSDFDVDHRFVASMVYQLPVGRGKRFGNSMNKAADLALGGWQLSTITTFQRGFPFSIVCNNNLLVMFSFDNRCEQIGNPYPSGFHKTLNSWFDNSVGLDPTDPGNPNQIPAASCVNPNLTAVAFCQTFNGQFGNSGRNILRGPGINNWDIGVGKDFKFTERIAFQFRAETFNAFNHHQYGYDPFTSTAIGSPVGNNPNNPGYGQVIAARPGRIVQFGGKIVF
jgi:Carboxypeptidase regulatory-like domain/TonB dependent receptor